MRACACVRRQKYRNMQQQRRGGTIECTNPCTTMDGLVAAAAAEKAAAAAKKAANSNDDQSYTDNSKNHKTGA